MSNDLKGIICLQGESYVEKEVDWFILKLPLEDLYDDLKGIRRNTSWFRKVAAFDHQCFHADQQDATVLYPMLSCEKQFGGKGTVPLRGNTLACLGSTIFTIGGNSKYHYGDKKKKKGSNLVHYFDTTQMSGSSEGPAWKQAPSMIIARYNPQVVVLDQKLYVFGCSSVHRCNHKTRCGVWAEVFDPNDGDGRLGVGRWRPLPDPPSLLFEEGYFVVVSPPTDLEGKIDNNNNSNKKKKILVFTSKTAYEFDVANHCWTVAKSDFHCRWGGHDVNPPIMVDDVLYWFENELHAYDIHKGVSFVGPVQDLLFHRCMIRTTRRDGLSEPQRPAIVHLGGRYFCLLLCVPDAAASSDRGYIHCLIIKASRTKDRCQQHEHKCMTSPEFFLSVSVVSCQSFPIHRLLHFLDGRMMLI